MEQLSHEHIFPLRVEECGPSLPPLTRRSLPRTPSFSAPSEREWEDEVIGLQLADIDFRGRFIVLLDKNKQFMNSTDQKAM